MNDGTKKTTNCLNEVKDSQKNERFIKRKDVMIDGLQWKMKKETRTRHRIKHKNSFICDKNEEDENSVPLRGTRPLASHTSTRFLNG